MNKYEYDFIPRNNGFEPPKYKWDLVIGGKKGVTLHMETPYPNFFIRFMYKFLLGWEVKKL